jgi:hypothetical protein
VISVSPNLLTPLRRGFATSPQRLAEQRGHSLMSTTGTPDVFESVGVALTSELMHVAIRCEKVSAMVAGERRRVKVAVEHHGPMAIATVPPYPVFLSHRWIDDAGLQTDGSRIPLGQPLLPDDSRTFEMSLLAPDAPGRHRLRISLVQEGVAWFDELAPNNGAQFDVTVTPADEQSQAASHQRSCATCADDISDLGHDRRCDASRLAAGLADVVVSPPTSTPWRHPSEGNADVSSARMPESDLEALRAENDELRRRVEVAEAEISELREDALARRAEVRAMAEALPAEVSRHALIRGTVRDALHHPDKRGVALRVLRKLGRAPVKAYRIAARKN